MSDRHWNGDRWVWECDVSEALNAAQLAIDEYYNGNRDFAEAWLLKAYEANQPKVPDPLTYDFYYEERS